ncbi:NAD(P)-binding domain-containing protein, partial [Cohnella faecalis]
MSKANIGVVGLAVMGRNLALNIESRGFNVAVYNRSREKTDDPSEPDGKGKNLVPTYSVEEFVASWKFRAKFSSWFKPAQAPTRRSSRSFRIWTKAISSLTGATLTSRHSAPQQAIDRARLQLHRTGVSGGEEGALKG